MTGVVGPRLADADCRGKMVAVSMVAVIDGALWSRSRVMNGFRESSSVHPGGSGGAANPTQQLREL